MDKPTLGDLKKHIPVEALLENIEGLPNSRKVLLFIGTLAILCAGFHFLKYKDLRKGNEALRVSITSQNERLAVLKRKAGMIAQVEAEVARIEEAFMKDLAMLPDQKEIPALLDNVSRLGGEVGIENILFQPQNEQQLDYYNAVPIRLELVGTYHQMGAFLDKISKLDRILKVEDLNMTRQHDSSRIQVFCTLYTYRYSDQPAPKKK